jgi:hypothetical protein
MEAKRVVVSKAWLAHLDGRILAARERLERELLAEHPEYLGMTLSEAKEAELMRTMYRHGSE